MGDEDFEDEEGDEGRDPRFGAEEFDPEDDDELKTEGSYSYGWGYNDAFDKPEDVDLESNPDDEDEQYAMGGSKTGGDDDGYDDDDDY